jgi:hypothetical protein
VHPLISGAPGNGLKLIGLVLVSLTTLFHWGDKIAVIQTDAAGRAQGFHYTLILQFAQVRRGVTSLATEFTDQ